MQAKAEADLVKALMDGLTTAGLIPEGIEGFSGPRRLVAVVEGLPVKSADVTEDVIGPKEGAPDAAIQGFLKKAGLTDISQAHVHDVPKKGRVYVAHVRKPGKQTTDVIAALVPQIIRAFHWPKSMRWGSGDLRWVRPDLPHPLHVRWRGRALRDRRHQVLQLDGRPPRHGSRAVPGPPLRRL